MSGYFINMIILRIKIKILVEMRRIIVRKESVVLRFAQDLGFELLCIYVNVWVCVVYCIVFIYSNLFLRCP